MDLVKIVSEFGFPVVMVMGLGYFVYFVWQTITTKIDPAVQETYRPTAAVRPRHDTITNKNKHCSKTKV